MQLVNDPKNLVGPEDPKEYFFNNQHTNCA